eukprot:snap_masked-scaffold561_size136864-processed-gene-0.7 protein:Tk09519 transcript:snap_masked-scaffold561_size136864-processed-gene-0.7-mRNA-1 annotation:"histone-lysine n-"
MSNGTDVPASSAVDRLLDVAMEVSSGDSSEDIPEEPRSRVESERKRVVVDWQCLNPACTSRGLTKTGLGTASRFVTEYFAVPVESRCKRKVCDTCRGEASQAHRRMVERAHSGQTCLEPHRPTPRDMVTLDDSDEEMVADSSSEEELDLELEKGRPTPGQQVQALIQDCLRQAEFSRQVDQAIEHIDQRLQVAGQIVEATSRQFRQIESDVDQMREALYQPFRPKLSHLPPVDLNALDVRPCLTPSSRPPTGMVVSEHTNPGAAALPPIGELHRPVLTQGDLAFAMRGNLLHVWKVGTVTEIHPDGPELTFKIRFEVYTNGRHKGHQIKILTKKHLAAHEPANVRLPVGTRVIAIYSDPVRGGSDFFSGVVAEPPKVMNKFRYLVFFDDGYAAYIFHHDVRVVCHQTKEVWEDVHPNSREFIKKYLLQYPERPMVKLNVGQIVRTEWEGKWWITKVVDVDASLVRLVFQVDKRSEMVYRGSTRLGPLFLEMQQQKRREDHQGGGNFARRHRMGAPFVEYTRQVDPTQDDPSANGARRAVARKSTSAKKSSNIPGANFTPQIKWESKGEVKRVEVDIAAPKPFVPHKCGSKCLGTNAKYQYEEKQHKIYNPLLIPVILGWQRQLTKHKNSGRRTIFYVAPCGRRLRNLEEVLMYMGVTECLMEIDFFTFEWWVHVYNEFKPERELCSIKDVSYGKENVPISCVNSLDKNFPEYVEYSRVRLPQKNVNLNKDEDFLVCCDCTDNCLNKAKCACWQLTIQSTAASPDGMINANVGYSYRRLHESVPTGIFECNPRCQCKQACVNRVAQNSLRSKLQVFKTERRGWGIRTLCDIPAGGFICIYVGNLYASEEANVHGQNFGDEYFAELDMIETVEKQKEGYESDYDDEECEILSAFNDSESAPSTEDEDSVRVHDKEAKEDLSEFRANVPFSNNPDRQTRSRDKSDRKKRVSYAEANGDPGDENIKEKKPKLKSTRLFFGEEEDVYIMDAKSIGNIGRYLNHSCTPNVFVQNCFVDTHDLRFPWVAFFSSTYIRAGQELCWDYCYIVDQVKGKEIYCQCGSDQCRGRLL